MFIIPPWWHYDEPGHFEYAWLVANHSGWPQVGQYDQEMRREVGYSLMQSGWYQIRNFHPDLSGSEPITIGVPQVGDVPGYYFLASLPLRFLHNANILIQYYAVRSISFLLYLLIILTAWYALGEILPNGHPLRWMVPAFLALLPAFVDTMTAANNDVSAVLASSLFLWASLKLMKRGFSFGRVAFLIISLSLCYLSKNTAWFAFILAPLVLLFSIQRGKFEGIKLGTTALAFILLLLVTLQWGSPLAWYQQSPASSLMRTQTISSPAGSYAFQIGGSGINSGGQIMQFLSRGRVESLQGKIITLGAWMWASQDTQVALPTVTFLTHGGSFVDSPLMQLSLTNQSTFYHQTISVPADAINATISIRYDSQAVSNNQIFFNGLALTVGEFSSNPPQFSDSNGTAGKWDNRPFQNLIRNGSAKQVGFRLRPWVDRKTTELLSNHGINPPLILATIQDWQGTGKYYRDSAATMFKTFWASLAGDKVPLPGAPINYFLVLATLIAVAGAAYALWVKRGTMHWDIVFILGMALIIPWIMAATRGVSGFIDQNPLFPWARYAYPAILPTALMLCTGWLELLEFFKTRLKFTDTTRNAIFLGTMFALSTIAILSAILAFHQGWWMTWGSLVAFLFLLLTTFLLIERIASRNSQSH